MLKTVAVRNSKLRLKYSKNYKQKKIKRVETNLCLFLIVYSIKGTSTSKV